MVTPLAAFQRLQELAGSGGLDEFCEHHGLRLLVVFGSVTGARPANQARDLDVAVSWSDPQSRDVLGLVNALMDLTGCDAVDVLDLDHAGIVARDQALSWGRGLYESDPGEFAREQMRAALVRMDTEWLRTLSLEVMGGR